MSHQFGLATYRQGTDPGTLIAEWAADALHEYGSDLGIGLAKPIGKSTVSFEGDYEVEYWHSKQVSTFTLKIEKFGTIYKLYWSKAGEVTNTGYGFVSDGLLVAGFTL